MNERTFVVKVKSAKSLGYLYAAKPRRDMEQWVHLHDPDAIVTVHEVEEDEGSEGDRIGQILAVIEARLPLTLIDSEDGRDIWPD